MRKVFIFLLCLIIGLALVWFVRNIYLQESQKTVIPEIESQEIPAFKIWKVGDNQGGFGFFDTAIFENGRAWAVGYDGHDPKRLYFSNNYGKNWQYETFPQFIMLHRIQFV